MFSLSLWISFHRFRPGLFLGPANRTQPPPRDSRDSRVIVTLALGPNASASLNDLLHIRTLTDELCLVLSLSFLFDSLFNPERMYSHFSCFKC